MIDIILLGVLVVVSFGVFIWAYRPHQPEVGEVAEPRLIGRRLGARWHDFRGECVGLIDWVGGVVLLHNLYERRPGLTLSSGPFAARRRSTMTLARITSPPAAASARLAHSQSPEHVRTSRRRSSPGNEQGAGRILRPGAFLVVTDLLEQGNISSTLPLLLARTIPEGSKMAPRTV